MPGQLSKTWQREKAATDSDLRSGCDDASHMTGFPALCVGPFWGENVASELTCFASPGTSRCIVCLNMLHEAQHDALDALYTMPCCPSPATPLLLSETLSDKIDIETKKKNTTSPGLPRADPMCRRPCTAYVASTAQLRELVDWRRQSFNTLE